MVLSAGPLVGDVAVVAAADSFGPPRPAAFCIATLDFLPAGAGVVCRLLLPERLQTRGLHPPCLAPDGHVLGLRAAGVACMPALGTRATLAGVRDGDVRRTSGRRAMVVAALPSPLRAAGP